MDYQWYPGHMTKTIRELKESIKLIDLVIEIVDARIPLSGRNPDINELAGGRARMVILGKCDLADESETSRWLAWYREQGYAPVACDLRKNGTVKGLTPAILEACKEKIERDRRKGIMNRPVRAMVAGIPNAGKSTFINSFSGAASAKTGNKPGVTKGRQWIRISRQVQLLDTPGLLWPKFENQDIGRKIAWIGSIPDTILQGEELACGLISWLAERERYQPLIPARYGIDASGSPEQILEAIGRSRGCLRTGNTVDTGKAAAVLMDDFRSGRLGSITLETVEDCTA